MIRALVAVPRALVESTAENLAGPVARFLAPIYPPVYPRIMAWRYRRQVENCEAALDALKDAPRLYGALVDAKHPGTPEQKREAVLAERDYYARLAEILDVDEEEP